MVNSSNTNQTHPSYLTTVLDQLDKSSQKY